ncbi:MAG: ABC transporter ATP-binding protein [Pseudomonadota bacterium]
MTPLLEIKDLNKSFGGVQATKNITLEVLEGEVHAIIGPNGAGKTTLIAQLSGGTQPDGGAILFNGQPITKLAAHQRARLGMARSFQITSLLMNMTVADNVALAAQAHEGHSFRFFRPARKFAHLRNAAQEALERVGLALRGDDVASALSHGERRQLEIAVALATKAEFLLLDEPMAGMGIEETSQMIELLRSLKGQKTMLLVEHDMDAVFALADRISVLVYGSIIATGTPEEIRSNDAVRAAYLGED